MSVRPPKFLRSPGLKKVPMPASSPFVGNTVKVSSFDMFSAALRAIGEQVKVANMGNAATLAGGAALATAGLYGGFKGLSALRNYAIEQNRDKARHGFNPQTVY